MARRSARRRRGRHRHVGSDQADALRLGRARCSAIPRRATSPTCSSTSRRAALADLRDGRAADAARRRRRRRPTRRRSRSPAPTARRSRSSIRCSTSSARVSSSPDTGIVLNDRLANLVVRPGEPQAERARPGQAADAHAARLHRRVGRWHGHRRGHARRTRPDPDEPPGARRDHRPRRATSSGGRPAALGPRHAAARRPTTTRCTSSRRWPHLAPALAARGHRVEVVDGEQDDQFGNCTVVGATRARRTAAADRRRSAAAVGLLRSVDEHSCNHVERHPLSVPDRPRAATSGRRSATPSSPGATRSCATSWTSTGSTAC